MPIPCWSVSVLHQFDSSKSGLFLNPSLTAVTVPTGTELTHPSQLVVCQSFKPWPGAILSMPITMWHAFCNHQAVDRWGFCVNNVPQKYCLSLNNRQQKRLKIVLIEYSSQIPSLSRSLLIGGSHMMIALVIQVTFVETVWKKQGNNIWSHLQSVGLCAGGNGILGRRHVRHFFR